MHLLLINQFLPPDPSPTARLLGELGDSLTAAGHQVTYVGESGGYRDQKTVLGSRALREITSLLRILVAGTFKRRIDAVVCFTSPPLVPFIAQLLSLRHRAALVHWAMDVYPDVAVALGDVRPTSLLHRLTSNLMARAYHRARLVVALDGDMEQVLRRGGANHTRVCPPWPPPISDSPSGQNQAQDSQPGFRWLYSGNLGRAHEWKTLLDAQRRLEEDSLPIDLVFQGGGPQRKDARRYADRLRLQRCLWLDYASDENLVASHLQADVIIVTQLPQTRGLLWPSKLALARCLPRPIVFVGDTASSVAAATTAHSPDSAAFSPTNDAALAAHLAALFHATHPPSSKVHPIGPIARTIREKREQGTSLWLDWIENLSAPSKSPPRPTDSQTSQTRR